MKKVEYSKKMRWKRKGHTIKYWQGMETGGYDVFDEDDKMVNDDTFSNFPRAVNFVRRRTRKRRC